MNNYQNYINNFMEQFSKIDKGYPQENVQKNALYDPYQGLIRGNMFKSLYDPYKLKQPYDIKPMNEQAEMLTYIDALCFACIDLNLYLDIHPNNQEALNLFNKYRQEKINMINQYENQFGPLTLDSNSLNSYPWAWDDQPWPWEGN